MALIEDSLAPDFTLESTCGNHITLNDLQHKYIILYFYPKDDTSGCTNESIQFKDLYGEFKSHDAEIFGISKDSIKSHHKFREKYDLPFNLLSNEKIDVIEKYECWIEKSMYGKKYMGIERSTFLLNQNKKIIGLWRKVKVPNHADAVLEKIKSQ